MTIYCPNCHSSATYQVGQHDMANTVHELSKATAIIGMSVNLCRSLNLPTGAGVIAGAILSEVLNQTQSSSSVILGYQTYRCQNCLYVFPS